RVEPGVVGAHRLALRVDEHDARHLAVYSQGSDVAAPHAGVAQRSADGGVKLLFHLSGILLDGPGGGPVEPRRHARRAMEVALRVVDGRFGGAGPDVEPQEQLGAHAGTSTTRACSTAPASANAAWASLSGYTALIIPAVFTAPAASSSTARRSAFSEAPVVPSTDWLR